MLSTTLNPRRTVFYRHRMAGLMLFSDLMGLFLAIGCASFLFHRPFLLIENAIVPLIALSIFMLSRLYPGTGLNPPQEIRMVTLYTLIAFLFGQMIDLLSGNLLRLHIAVNLLAWVLAPVAILTLRWSIRILAGRLRWWGEPVAVIARGKKAGELVHYFRKRLRLGYDPVAAISDLEGAACYTPIAEEPVFTLEKITDALPLLRQRGVCTALVDLSAAPDLMTPAVGAALKQIAPHLIFLSDLSWVEGASLQTHDFEGLLGVEIYPNELSPFSLLIKSVMDVSLSALALILLSPWLGLIAALIKLDSPGSVFYTHKRIGKGEQNIKIMKFRTMRANAAEELETYLQANPAARREWQENHKLRHDPRITRIGKILRKFSLDELPQFINVLRGDISLVGARPIVASEVHHYAEQFPVYTRFKPGLTGLWQVSGRNNTTYDERVRYDTYYIHNWSIWLDIYILLRTVWVVISRDGAY